MAKVQDKAQGEAQILRHFLNSYVQTWDALNSALCTGQTLYRSPPLEGSYVYALLSPDMGKIIYVGKGTGRRMFHHVRDVRRGHVSGLKKYKAIRDLIENGLEPVPVILMKGLSSRQALTLERLVIGLIGRVNLSNSLPGEGDRWEIAYQKVYPVYKGMGNVCAWLRSANVTPDRWSSIALAIEAVKRGYGFIQEMRHA